MGSETGNFVLLGVSAVLLACVVVRDRGDDVVGHVLIIGAILCYGCLYTLCATRRITLTDAGVVVTARVWQRFVPWSDLVSVDMEAGVHHVLHWRTRSRTFMTRPSIVGVDHLLREIQARAPHVLITSSRPGQFRWLRRRSGVGQ